MVPGKSAVALRVTVWDDATQTKLNEETHLVHVIQVFESRLSLTREEQMRRLADQASLQIEQWLREQMEAEGWFLSPGAETVASAEQAAQSLASSEAVAEAALAGQ